MSDQDSMEQVDENPLNEQASDSETPFENEDVGGSPVRRWMNYNSLLLLGLLAAVGGSTYLMCLRAGAATTPHTDPTVTKNATAITNFLSGGGGNLRQMMVMIHQTEEVVKQFDKYPSTTQVPLSDLRTNPFQSSLLPQDSQVVALSPDAEQRDEEQQREAAQSVIKELKLQSVICGTHSMCIINSKTYSQGQGNGSFIVEQITPDGVWVLVGSVRHELKIAPPELN